MADHTPAIELESAEGLTISSKGPLRSAATRDFLAGALGGALGIVLGQPLDTVRVRQQQACACSRSTLSTLGSMMRCEGLLSPCKGMTYPLAASALQSAIMFYAYGSAMRYMHGGSASTAAATSSRTSSGGAASTSAPAFSPGFETAQPLPESTAAAAAATASHLPRPRLRDVALAGMVAGAAQAAFIAPIELLKIRMQLQTAPTGSPHYLRPGPMLRHVLRTEGLGGLFRGTLATLYRDIPGCGCYFLTYHAATRLLEPAFSGIAGGSSSTGSSSGSSSDGSSGSSARSGGGSGSSSISSFGSSSSAAAGAVAPAAAAGTAAGVPATGAQMLAQLVAGGLAGTLGWLATYPADVVKTQLQSGRRHDEPAAHPGGTNASSSSSSSFLACARRMYHTQGGAAAFYRGLAPTLQRAFVVNSVTFLGYEYVAAALDRQA